MNTDLYKNLHAEGLISDESFEKINHRDEHPLFSVHWEIRTMLYVGVLLLTGGLGILIYENIDSIGHQAVLLFILLISAGSFVYCFKNKLPFSTGQVRSPNPYFDYILLLGSISLVTFVGYLQFEYHVFGIHYGMAALVPMLLLFFIAYYFDHLGVLSMAIVDMGLWMGVSVTPKDLLLHLDFDSETLVYTYVVLGLILMGVAFLTGHFKFKPHFKFSYLHYGVHITYISLLAGYFHFYDSIFAAVWMLGVFLLSLFIYIDAMKGKSFYFLLLMVLYSYIAVSSLIIRVLISMPNGDGFFLILLYFVASALVLIFLLINFNKKLKAV